MEVLNGLVRAAVMFACIVVATHTAAFAQSSDGTWTRQALIRVDNYSVSLSAIAAADTSNLIASGIQDINDLIFRSSNGGSTWELVHVDTATEFDYPDLAHPTPSLCIAVGNRGHIMRSSDGGSSWSVVPCDAKAATTDSMSMTQITMYDSLHGFAAGFTQVLLRTRDGGLSWQRLPNPLGGDSTSLGFSDIACPTPHTLIALMGGVVNGQRRTAVYRSDDDGEHWSSVDIPTQSSLGSICFVDSLHGWIAGYGKTGQPGMIQNMILRTIDGGHSWDTVLEEIVPGDNSGTIVKFCDPLHGMAVMCGDRTFRTTDGGATWGVYTKLTQNFALLVVTDLAYPDSTRAWTVSSTGKIMLFSTQGSSTVPLTEAGSTNEYAARLYPNPALSDGPAYLSYTLPHPAHVRVVLVNSLGDEVVTMTDAQVDGGAHTLALSRPESIASGAYFLRFSIDGHIETIPFAIVR
jgi:photosystem II stability/assembly factor-like uncharacterized protein